MPTTCATRIDRRFAAQQVPHERWREATAANLAADHRNGFDLHTMAFTGTRPEWQEFGRFLVESSDAELDDYVHRNRGDSLLFLVMMLTGACNADCAICFTDRRRRQGEMTSEIRDSVLRQAAELGARYVYVPGEGEPTIDRGWWHFLETCRELELEAIVFTNGLVFSDARTCRHFWECELDEAVGRLADYPVSLYNKMWSTRPDLVGEMMGIDPAKYDFQEHEGVTVSAGMIRLLEGFPRERLGIEVVVERRNADEVLEEIVPFADRHDLRQIVEMIQHNGRTLGNPAYDPSPAQAAAVGPYLSPTSCSLATSKAVVTTRGYLSPRIAILEHQIPHPRARVGDGELWDLLHTTDYLVQRRYELSCLCESEPAALAGTRDNPVIRRVQSIVPPALATVVRPPETEARSPDPAGANGARALVPDVRIHDLATGGASHRQAVRVTGRVLPRHGGLALADGPVVVEIAGADPPPYAWVTLTGEWDAVRAHLDVRDTRVVRQPDREPAAGAAPDLDAAREPARLQAVVDRAAAVAELRRMLEEREYLEVTTPTLQTAAEMSFVAQAVTEPIGGRRFYLRTDPEEHLKRYLTAGLPAVYEISTNVRGDPEDRWHLTEFQSVEYYRRLVGFDEALELADVLIGSILTAVARGPVEWRGTTIDPRDRFPRLTFAEAFTETIGVDVESDECASAEGLVDALRSGGATCHVEGDLARWRRSWLEEALSRHVLPRLDRATWVTHFPADLALSARLDPDDPRRSLRAELFLPGGLELAQVYENLTEGAELRARYESRRAHRVAGGLPYVPSNEGLFESAHSGMPPMSGGAVGLDRVLMVARGDQAVGAGLLFGGHPAATPDGSCGGCTPSTCGCRQPASA
jgi:lysyl-tRNA synthetase class 2